MSDFKVGDWVMTRTTVAYEYHEQEADFFDTDVIPREQVGVIVGDEPNKYVGEDNHDVLVLFTGRFNVKHMYFHELTRVNG